MRRFANAPIKRQALLDIVAKVLIRKDIVMKQSYSYDWLGTTFPIISSANGGVQEQCFKPLLCPRQALGVLALCHVGVDEDCSSVFFD